MLISALKSYNLVSRKQYETLYLLGLPHTYAMLTEIKNVSINFSSAQFPIVPRCRHFWHTRSLVLHGQPNVKQRTAIYQERLLRFLSSMQQTQERNHILTVDQSILLHHVISYYER